MWAAQRQLRAWITPLIGQHKAIKARREKEKTRTPQSNLLRKKYRKKDYDTHAGGYESTSNSEQFIGAARASFDAWQDV